MGATSQSVTKGPRWDRARQIRLKLGARKVEAVAGGATGCCATIALRCAQKMDARRMRCKNRFGRSDVFFSTSGHECFPAIIDRRFTGTCILNPILRVSESKIICLIESCALPSLLNLAVPVFIP